MKFKFLICAMICAIGFSAPASEPNIDGTYVTIHKRGKHPSLNKNTTFKTSYELLTVKNGVAEHLEWDSDSMEFMKTVNSLKFTENEKLLETIQESSCKEAVTKGYTIIHNEVVVLSDVMFLGDKRYVRISQEEAQKIKDVVFTDISGNSVKLGCVGLGDTYFIGEIGL